MFVVIILYNLGDWTIAEVAFEKSGFAELYVESEKRQRASIYMICPKQRSTPYASLCLLTGSGFSIFHLYFGFTLFRLFLYSNTVQ